ncbi:MAG: hypothetical protein RLY78_1222 [Pseudomonadota bacterium]
MPRSRTAKRCEPDSSSRTTSVVHLRALLRLMALIQLIDLGAGVVATASGTVTLALSGFPMVNAVWIAAVCLQAGRRPRGTGDLAMA